jgi:hypothetical protein
MDIISVVVHSNNSSGEEPDSNKKAPIGIVTKPHDDGATGVLRSSLSVVQNRSYGPNLGTYFSFQAQVRLGALPYLTFSAV